MSKAKKIFLVIGIILVVIIIGFVLLVRSFNGTVGEMTEPIRQEFAGRENDTFRIRDSAYQDTVGTAIVTITNKEGEIHEEKYFLKKTDNIWVIDKKEPYVAPTPTPETVKNEVKNTSFSEVTIVDGNEVVAKKDGDTYVINERNRYFARVTLAEPLTQTTSFKHTYKKTSSGFVRGFKTEVLFPKDPPLTIIYVELKPNDGVFSTGTYESIIDIGDNSVVIKYRIE